jgi:hypothetical protein
VRARTERTYGDDEGGGKDAMQMHVAPLMVGSCPKLQTGHIRVKPKASQFNKPVSASAFVEDVE